MTFGGTTRSAGLFILFSLVVLSGCAPPTVTPVGPPSVDPGLAAFLQDCQARAGMWRAGQIRYPATLSLEMGASTSYTASIDVGPQPVGPTTEVPGSTPGAPVQVQCAVAARLVPVGKLKVEPSDWSVRSFTPSAKVDWAWTISAQEAADQQLRLEVQPAIRGDNGFGFVGDTGPQTASFITDVAVDATLIQRVYQYISDNQAAALGIGAAVILALGFASRLKKAVRSLLGRRQQDDDEGDDEDLVGAAGGDESGNTDDDGSDSAGRAAES